MAGAAEVVRRDGRDELGEGLLWSVREQALYWTDILGQRVHRLDPASGAIRSWALPDLVGWLIERRDHPGFVAGLGHAIVTLDLDPLAIRTIASPDPGRRGNRMNDAKADRYGRIWAGTMARTADRPTGAFYRLDPDHCLVRVDDRYTIANGPAIAADGRTMLHTDTGARTIYRYAVRDDGSLGPRAPFITFERDWGAPDGMTFDAEGFLWVACWGGGRIMRFDPMGAPVATIVLPATQISNVAFGGAALDRLFISSAAVDKADEPLAGALFMLDPGCRGLPAGQFGG